MGLIPISMHTVLKHTHVANRLDDPVMNRHPVQDALQFHINIAGIGSSEGGRGKYSMSRLRTTCHRKLKVVVQCTGTIKFWTSIWNLNHFSKLLSF